MPPTTQNDQSADPGPAPVPLGFPQEAARLPQDGASAWYSPVSRPTPLPKRPKGRWFVGIILVLAVGYAGFRFWDGFARYRAYGVVEGRVIQVSAPWEGALQYVHVREGDKVQQGQVLMTVDNLALRQQYAMLTHQLRITQASLEAQNAKLKWQAAYRTEQSQSAVAQYHQAAGDLLQAKATLAGLQIELERTRLMYRSQAVSAKELNLIESQVRGQEERVRKLNDALAELKIRAEQTRSLVSKGDDLKAGLEESGANQVKPLLAQLESLQTELDWTRQRLAQGQVVAPTNGVVVRRQRFAGELCKAGDPLLTVLEEGSLQIALYLPQSASHLLAVGDEAHVSIEPYSQSARCTVRRLGERFEAAPDNIERFYLSKEKLQPVYLQPNPEVAAWMNLKVGEVVKLPYRLNLKTAAGDRP